MKKTWIPLLLVTALLAVPMAGGALADGQEPASDPPVLSAPQAAAPEQELCPAGGAPAQSTRLDALYPPVNALVLSMVEQGMEYDERSDTFVWNVLYYMLSLYGQMDSRAQLTDQALVIPRETAQDFLAALFAGRGQLPDLPGDLSGRIRYDRSGDQFMLELGDAGLTECRLDALEPQMDGTCLLNGELVSLDSEETLYRFQVTLEENESMFGYAILDAIIF